MSLVEVEAQAKTYADARSVLTERVENLNARVESLKRQYLRGIKNAVAEAKEQRLILEAVVEDNADVFRSPRTHIFHGIKVGYRHCRGKDEFSDGSRVVALIRKLMPEQAEGLIQCTESPDKKALGELTRTELRSVGARLVGAGDQVVIKPADSSVDKVVEALLADETTD